MRALARLRAGAESSRAHDSFAACNFSPRRGYFPPERRPHAVPRRP
ncbi:hypothetical protein [Nannocystis pusilla]|uniref:Uncharacterized protein n=1 Tax=Nannocystis pusilla TaxID=889268 RepID=A0ABS7TQD0_9BACT|nr:hypothetical protein [Nannocystis pusilla]MBZ5710442.1 hypothetical protein [Nannocystis pusilla]